MTTDTRKAELEGMDDVSLGRAVESALGGKWDLDAMTATQLVTTGNGRQAVEERCEELGLATIYTRDAVIVTWGACKLFTPVGVKCESAKDRPRATAIAAIVAVEALNKENNRE